MFDVANRAIENVLLVNWTATDIDFDNVSTVPSRGSEFIRLQIEWADAQRVSIGGKDRGYGFILVSIFTEVNIGTTTADSYADMIRDLYSNKSIGPVVCMSAVTQRVGQMDEWYQLNVRIPFTCDECTN